jgi:diguanylate cyclase (GGDEF)-like protein/PAS domain S-box-containing protein
MDLLVLINIYKRFRLPKVCLFFLILFPSLGVFALEPLQRNPILNSFSTSQGLIQDSVTDLVVDKDGFIWVATEGGLDRWDGYRFTHVSGPQNQLLDVPIESLYQASDQAMWVGTANSGVYRYDITHNTLELMVKLPYLTHASLTQSAGNFFEQENGDVLISLDHSLVRYRKDVNQVETLLSLTQEQADNGQFIRYVYQYEHLIFVASNKGLLVADESIKPLTFKPLNYLGNLPNNLDSINSKYLYVDEHQDLWIGTVSGLYRLPIATLDDEIRLGASLAGQSELIIPKRNIWELVREETGQYWVATDLGVIQLRTDGHNKWQYDLLFEPSVGMEELSKKDIPTLVADRDGSLWMGTYINGILFWSKNSSYFSSIQNMRWSSEHKPLSNNVIWGLNQTQDGALWIGTDNGLNRYDLITHKSQSYLTDDSSIGGAYTKANIVNVLNANEGYLYLETYDGMYLFNTHTGEDSPIGFDNQGEHLIFAYGANVDTEQRLYFISDHFYRYDPKTQVTEILYDLEKNLDPSLTISFLGELPSNPNKLLVATNGEVWLVDKNTLSAQLIHSLPKKLKSREKSTYDANSFVELHKTLYIAYTGYGLVAIDSTTFQQIAYYDRKALGNSDIIYGLQKDERDNLWFSSHSGIHRFSPATNHFSHYASGKDISVAEFNQGANTVLENGVMAYGSPQGVIMFDPKKLNREHQKHLGIDSRLMAISGASLSSRALNLPMTNLAGHHIDLEHSDYGLTIYFSPLTFEGRSQMSFRYILSSGEQVLSDAITNDTQVHLPSLPSGDYRFEVMPASQMMDKILLPASITLSIPYPPLRSPLAYTTYVLIFVGLLSIYLFNRHVQQTRLKYAEQKVKLFGNAFKQTRDWVIIFDANKQPVATNPSFEKIFGIDHTGDIQHQIDLLYRTLPRLKRQLSDRLNNMKSGDFWKDEDIIQLGDGRTYDVIINISVMTADKNEHMDEHYLIVISDISQQKNAERKLMKIANYDNLTGLVNRSLLLDRLERAIAKAKIQHTKVAVLFVDLDRFKGINDSLGHDYGDKLLRVIAHRMLNLASANDTVARLGGDEFVIVMEDVENLDSISSIVGSLIESVETPISLGLEVLRVSCSIGVSFYPNDATDPGELLKQADVAMYSAKKDTLNNFTYFTEDMNERARERLQLENQVKNAYQDNCFLNYYQPIVNVENGKTEGVELLLRCCYKGQWISPVEFIPILEELRYIIDVTRQAMERSICDIAYWYQLGFRGYVSINLSALHFKTHFDLDGLLQTLADASLPPSALRFEITEGVLMDDSDDTLAKIQQMIGAGFSLALDDFGTGFSSLSYLKRFPLQVLKIDKSFIDDIGSGKADNALVTTTIALALNLDMTCIAEGIEHKAQAQYLQEHGCILQQGYLFSKPVEAKFVADLLAKNWQLSK